MRTRLHHLITDTATRHPDASALTYKDLTLSYGELRDAVCRVASALLGCGVNRDDRVAIYLEKRLETVAAIFGISAAGGVFVPINHVLRANQVGYILADCDVRVLVTSADRLGALAETLDACPHLEQVIVVGWDGPAETRGRCRVVGWDTVTGPSVDPEAPGVDLDMGAILYTSGSTGKPKGVVLSHRNLIVGAESVSGYLSNTADDVILSALPLSFDAGLSQLTTAFSVGAHVILMNYLLPGDVVKLCARHAVTGLTCVPPLWIQIAAVAWPEEVARRLRYFANTGGRMPKATLEELRRLFTAAKPYLMYGLTEAFRSTYLDPDQVDTRPDSIGKAIPNAEILVVRPDGTPCGPGEEGELVHRGPLVALGYWNNPEKTAERFKPAPGSASTWRAPELAVFSGDAVVADEDGYLYFVGRRDEMIKTSGYRVSPTEIEEVAYDTGLVRDAVAVGIDDDKLGQRVVLLATAADGQLDPKDLLARMRKLLPLYMVPSVVEVRAQLPKSPNGKFDRVLLKRELVG